MSWSGRIQRHKKLAERRARIILLAASGLGVEETADKKLGIWRKTRRHVAAPLDGRLEATAGVAARLNDAPRSGAPARGSHLRGDLRDRGLVLLEDPEALAKPISERSQSELARQAVQRGIVESISHGSVGRFLKSSGPSTASYPLLADTEARSRLRREMC